MVLYFYPKDNTHGCTIEAHTNFQRDSAKYEQAKVVVVGVAWIRPAANKDFCAEQGLTFKLLADLPTSNCRDTVPCLVAVKIAKRNTFSDDPNGKI